MKQAMMRISLAYALLHYLIILVSRSATDINILIVQYNELYLYLFAMKDIYIWYY